MSPENPEALFKEWLRVYGGIVGKVARAYTFTAEDCQDLAQEILLQVWRSLPQFEGRAGPGTWFYRVALNTALCWHRNQHRRHLREAALPVLEHLTAPAESPGRIEQRELVERLYAAIRQLPRADSALVLLYLEDLSYRDMAEVLGISESNVGVKLNRAKKMLAELMKEVVHES